MSRLALGRFKHAPDGCGRRVQTNASVGDFCGAYDYEGCKNDPECVWCLEMTDSGAGCLHLSTSTVTQRSFISGVMVTTLPGKSWNLVRPFSRPGKSWKTAKVMESHGK